MKQLGCSLIAVLAACSLAAAQDVEKKSQTKISVEDGRSVTVTGCVARGTDGFTLTNVAGKDGALGSYMLVSEDDDADDLKDHVGHRVEITGKAADQGKGKITIETKNERTAGDGDTSTTTSKSEVKGNLRGIPYLGVKSLRMVASVCP